MKTVLIANAKGGSGKTTLATNLAGWFASRHAKVGISDQDPQHSAAQWLSRRPPLFPKILCAENVAAHDLDWLVIDSPAGLSGEDLRKWVKLSDYVLVPLAPSAFDMEATEKFLNIVLEKKAVRSEKVLVGLLGMRVDARTQSALELENFLYGFDCPVLTHLRDTQVYVHCARNGLTIFDLPPSRGAQDWVQWKPIVSWVK
jgi:chromosome partitioning protein